MALTRAAFRSRPLPQPLPQGEECSSSPLPLAGGGRGEGTVSPRLALVAAALLLLGGCAAPIGEDGLPISLGQAACEAIPFHRCCRKPSPPSPPQPYCTRSLGVADCWTDPERLPGHQPDIADTPAPAPGCA